MYMSIVFLVALYARVSSNTRVLFLFKIHPRGLVRTWPDRSWRLLPWNLSSSSRSFDRWIYRKIVRGKRFKRYKWDFAPIYRGASRLWNRYSHHHVSTMRHPLRSITVDDSTMMMLSISSIQYPIGFDDSRDPFVPDR